MGIAEILALVAGLSSLARKLQTENREATEAEVDDAFAAADVQIDALEAAIARKRAREAAAGG